MSRLKIVLPVNQSTCFLHFFCYLLKILLHTPEDPVDLKNAGSRPPSLWKDKLG